MIVVYRYNGEYAIQKTAGTTLEDAHSIVPEDYDGTYLELCRAVTVALRRDYNVVVLNNA